MQYLIGLDIGTSSVKGILMTENGQIRERTRESFTYTCAPDGVVEIDAREYLETCMKAIRALTTAADGPVLGICASSASGNLLVLDKDGTPACPIINWQDTRVKDEAHHVLGEVDIDALYRRMGWPFNYQTFPLAHLCRIREQSPALLDDGGMVCMSTEYLYYTLTGKWGISTSAGTPFFLLDQQTGEYIPEILEMLGIRESQLPPVLPCGSVLGNILPEAAERFGVPAGIPIILGSFDHPSAARGVGVLEEGEMLLSCGTSWVGFFPSVSREQLAKGNLLIDPFLSPDGCWAGMVSASSLSNHVQKYVHRYIDASDKAYVILAALAADCPSGAGGLQICPLDSPDDDKVQGFSREQIARAIMEGSVRVLKEQLDRAERIGIHAHSAVMVGGPSENPLWTEIIEEICGLSVRISQGTHAGAVGAAVLAGIGAGIYRNEANAHRIFRDHIIEQEET
ncbi:MAG: hypothetical protein IKV57_05575 [Clostridia bacterium]|nr:hypothetical protein [Clostridia bacterium]